MDAWRNGWVRRALLIVSISTPTALALVGGEHLALQQLEQSARTSRTGLVSSMTQERKEAMRRLVTAAHNIVREVQQQAVPAGIKERKDLAAALLSKLTKQDGNDDDFYVYVYDTDGWCKVHPRWKECKDENRKNFRSPSGQPVIRYLINEATVDARRSDSGFLADPPGRFVTYIWDQPSKGRPDAKQGYVELDAKWGWVIGSGYYPSELSDAARIIEGPSAAARDELRLLFLQWGLGLIALAVLVALALDQWMAGIDRDHSQSPPSAAIRASNRTDLAGPDAIRRSP